MSLDLLFLMSVAITFALCAYLYPRAALLVPALAAVIIACASLRPQIQEARDDVVLACRKLTAAMVGDVSPSRAERIAQKVCLAETMASAIEREAEADAEQLFTETLPIDTTLADAGTSGATAH